MKKIISLILVLSLLVSSFSSTAFAGARTAVRDKCMHMDDMVKNGYWTNKDGEPVCGCKTCKVILSDYKNLDKIVTPENAHILSHSIIDILDLFIKNERWKNPNNKYLMISVDRKDASSFVAFNKNEQINYSDEDWKEIEPKINQLGKIVSDMNNGIAPANLKDIIYDLKNTCPKILSKALNANYNTLTITVIAAYIITIASIILVSNNIKESDFHNLSNKKFTKQKLKSLAKIIVFPVALLSVVFCIPLSMYLGDIVQKYIIKNSKCINSIDYFSEEYKPFKNIK